jgi:hypothetical protein
LKEDSPPGGGPADGFFSTSDFFGISSFLGRKESRSYGRGGESRGATAFPFFPFGISPHTLNNALLEKKKERPPGWSSRRLLWRLRLFRRLCPPRLFHCCGPSFRPVHWPLARQVFLVRLGDILLPLELEVGAVLVRGDDFCLLFGVGPLDSGAALRYRDVEEPGPRNVRQ